MNRTRLQANPENRPESASSIYLETAIAIASSLSQTAVTGEYPGVTWLGDDLLGKDVEHLQVVRDTAVGPDYYGGAAGIAWFLAHAGVAASSPEILERARQGIEYALGNTGAALGSDNLSFLSGATGVAVAAYEIGLLLGQDEIIQAGLELADKVANFLSTNSLPAENDYIGGLSGIIVGYISLYHLTGEDKYISTVKYLAQQLADRSSIGYRGRAWDFTDEQPALCGLAHGASGIGLGLWEAALATRDEKLLGIAGEALQYERSWYSGIFCAWPDLREAPKGQQDGVLWPGWMSAWCHGAIGIGITRLLMVEHDPSNVTYLADVTAALQSARGQVVQTGNQLKQGQYNDVTLCHGLAGIIEFLLLAAEVFHAKEHYIAARRVGDLCLKIFKENNKKWPVGLTQCTNVPGLFLGFAGIGATMLRLHDSSLLASPILPGHLRIRMARKTH